VTGGAGYIGSVLVRKLLEKGYEVRVLDRLIFTKEPLKEVLGRITLDKGDIRDLSPEIFDGIDAVVHLAGFSTDPTSDYNPRLTDMVNHLATENLAKMARAKGVKRFIYASTCSIYFTFNTPLNPPLYKEADLVNPISSYSITKRSSEQLLWGMTGRDFQPTIFRKGTLYGFSPRMRYDLVFNSFAKDAFFKKLLTVDAGGEIFRPMIDIQDMVDIYLKSLEAPLTKVGGKIFNVADGNWKIGDLAVKIRDILKQKRGLDIKVDIRPYGLTRNYKVDTTLFKKTFDFKPSRSMEDALFEIWDHFENDKNHDPENIIHYGDAWYRQFFKTKEGLDFIKHV